MWLLKCTIEDSVVSEQVLRYDSTIRIGRHPTYEQDPNAIHLTGVRLSKRQFSIHVGTPTHINDVESQTPISLEFESTAITKVNDEKYHLADRDDNPFTKDFTDNLIIRIHMKFSKTETVRIDIKWIPIHISSYAKKIMANNEIRESPLPAKIQELYDAKIDIRSTSDALIATHYVTLTDLDNIQLRISLSRAIPILNLDWLDTMRDELNTSLQKWFYNPESYSDFLPRAINGDNKYLLPDDKRSNLFEKCLIVLFSDQSESPKKFKKLTAQISCLSANSVILDVSKYHSDETLDEKNLKEDIKLELQQYDNNVPCYIVFQISSAGDISFSSLLSKFAESHGGELVSDLKLFECIKNTSRSSLKAIDLNEGSNSKRSAISDSNTNESPLKLTQRRKRRKIEKATGLDFFDFTASPAPPTPSIATSPPPSLLIPSQLGTDRSSINNDTLVKEKDSSEESSNRLSKVVESIQESSQREHQSDVVTENRTEGPTAATEVRSEHTTKRDHDDLESVPNHENEPVDKKSKPNEPVKKKLKFTPQVSLVDAIRSAKNEQADTVKKELGIHNDDSSQPLDVKLHNLALVETIDIQFRRPRTKPTEDQSNKFHGRTNFKKFNKIQNVKSNLTRSFIELQSIPVNQVTFKSSTQDARDAVQLAEQRMSQDFDGIMADINGYKPVNPKVSFTEHVEDDADNDFNHSDDEDGGSFSFRTHQGDTGKSHSSLFVPADSQTSQRRSLSTASKASSSRISVSRPQNNDLQYDDDDDDDDEPRFAFSRT